MQRYPFDLSHFHLTCGNIGQLQTMACVPVIAGDSITFDMEGVFRLSPLRRNLVVDCKVDMFAFYVPHRHIYGDDWIDFMKAGTKEAETFTGKEVPAGVDASFLACEFNSGQTIPLWVIGGYNQIWNRYFRSPTDANERALDYFSGSSVEAKYGWKCGFLPTAWSTGVVNGVASGDREVSITNDILDIVDLERVRAVYRSEVDREFFAQRYTDLLDTVFGGNAGVDADQRPTLLKHSSSWLSGYDVDGTDDAALGQYSGKAAGVVRFNVPWRFFGEHGAYWVMALLRFPTIHVDERPYLNTVVNPSYLEISGDPELWQAEPPVTADDGDFFRNTAGGNSLGVIPFGQHYRYHPSLVHRSYDTLNGFTFLDLAVDSIADAHYVDPNEYDNNFSTTQLGHWQAQVRNGMTAKRVIPPARRSLYAGG